MKIRQGHIFLIYQYLFYISIWYIKLRSNHNSRGQGMGPGGVSKFSVKCTDINFNYLKREVKFCENNVEEI